MRSYASPALGATVIKRVLRVPLGAKLAGANLLIVLAAVGVHAVFHVATTDKRPIAILLVALALGLVMNMVLLSIALRPIRDLEETATRVWAGDLESRVPRSRVADADLAKVGGTLNFLLNKISDDRARIRTLAKEIVRTGDRERSHVGKELHESVAQSVAALRYQLIAVERETTDPELAGKIQAIRQAAGELLEEIRLLSHSVHPQILDDLGLVAALRHLARTNTAEPRITVSVDGEAERILQGIADDTAVALYRAAHEAVSNALRHAKPRAIEIRLGLAGLDIVMHVDDDGIGFDPAAVEDEGQRMGLFTMRERIRLVNGEVTITSRRERGTSVRVRVPPSTRAAVPPRSSLFINPNSPVRS